MKGFFMIKDNFGKLGKTQEEALAKIEPVLDAILKAQDEIDYEGFCASFEDGLRAKITKQDFESNAQSIQSTMGKLKEKQFLTTLTRKGMVGLIYKCKFEDTDDDFTITFTINDQVDPPKASGIWIS